MWQRLWPWLWKLALVAALLLGAVLLYLQAEVKKHFEGQRWTEPVAVYARTLMLREGLPLAAGDLRLELQLLGYRAREAPTQPGEFAQSGDRFLIIARAFEFSDLSAPKRKIEIALQSARVQQLRENGVAVESARLDPLLLGRYSPQGDEDRELVRLADAPPALVKALIATEDEDFYSHHGVSLWAILRAAWTNVREGEAVQGASTLTQQLVKNYFLNNERSWWRKIREGLMALVLDWNYSKDEILEAYLNEIFLGQDGQRAIHGVGLAARYYFGKPLAELDLAESALLVGVIRGPSYYSPWRHPDRARARRDHVLRRLVAVEELSAENAERWQRQALGVVKSPRALGGKIPAVLDWAKRELGERYGVREITASGLRVFTSVDPVLQRKAELVMAKTLDRLDSKRVMQGAMVITDRRSGALRAVIAGRDSSYAGFNRALDARRPVGSTLKPLIYYAALKRPEQFTLATPLQDAAFVMRSDDGRSWQPKNYDGRMHGNVPLMRALAQSLNLATARLTMEVGLGNVEKTLRELGLRRDITLWPSLALGALELSPVEVSALYSGIANGGTRWWPTAISAVRNGDTLLRGAAADRKAIDAGAAFLTGWALQAAVRDGTGQALATRFPQLNIAGKTGTTNDTRDAWFTGFDDEHLIVIWLGRDDNQATRLTGASGALAVFSDLLAVKRAAPLALQLPDGVRFGWLSGHDGERRLMNCDNAQWLPALAGTPVRESCEE